MTSIRLIDENDLDKFITFFSKFDNTERQQQLKNYILDKNPNIVIGAIFKNNDITGCLIGNTIDYNWPVSNVLPIFVTRGMKGIGTTPEERNILIRTVNGYFHAKKYYTLYKSYKFYKPFNYTNCSSKVDKFSRRAYNEFESESESYFYTIENIIPYDYDYNLLPVAYKSFVDWPCKENQVMVVIRGDLKYHLRGDPSL